MYLNHDTVGRSPCAANNAAIPSLTLAQSLVVKTKRQPTMKNKNIVMNFALIKSTTDD